jgi:hypothetical protein
MAKLDLALISRLGRGRPVPKEMDRHMVKYVIGLRKKAIEKDKSLFQKEVWDHSDVFYAIRTYLNRQGYDTSVYTDKVNGGTDRRAELYSMIKPVCENYYKVKRHQIGIYPEDRAVMAFEGKVYAASFDNLRTLMQKGTDIIVVEKQGTVVKMVPFTNNIGLAFIQSQGFVSEYGVALAQLCNQQSESAYDYTDLYVPQYKGHLGVLTDCDSSGIDIGLNIKDAVRIGIDLDTIQEINEANPGLDLKIDDMIESTKVNTHWKALKGMVDEAGNVYEGLSEHEAMFYTGYLSDYPASIGGNTRFLDWLEENRIELNTILALAKPQAFWNWLKAKILKIWPDRDYNRAINVDSYIYTPTLNDFIEGLGNKIKPIIADKVKKAEDGLSKVEGFYEDVDEFEDNVNTRKEEIETDISDNVLLQDEEIQKLDLALEKLMKKHKLVSS